jgi:hypothetical protein
VGVTALVGAVPVTVGVLVVIVGITRVVVSVGVGDGGMVAPPILRRAIVVKGLFE